MMRCDRCIRPAVTASGEVRRNLDPGHAFRGGLLARTADGVIGHGTVLPRGEGYMRVVVEGQQAPAARGGVALPGAEAGAAAGAAVGGEFVDSSAWGQGVVAATQQRMQGRGWRIPVGPRGVGTQRGLGLRGGRRQGCGCRRTGGAGR